ncbi:MAG: methyltransferase domain-containing protein, partial [Candidatus Eremiobacterota bacterium]
ALPFPDASLAAVTCAQALHWFDRPTFYSEVRRTLVTDGLLAVVDNNRDWREDPWMDAYESLLERLSRGSYSRHYRSLDHPAELADGGFSKVREGRFPWRRAMSLEDYLGLCLSSTKVQAVAAVVGTDRLVEEIRRLTAGDAVVIPYTTVVYLANR